MMDLRTLCEVISTVYRWFCCRKKKESNQSQNLGIVPYKIIIIIIIIIIIGESLSEPHTRELVENFLYIYMYVSYVSMVCIS